MSELQRLLMIALDILIWLFAAGFAGTALLILAGSISFLRDAIRKKDDFDRKTDRDMAIICGFFFVFMGVIAFALVLLGLSIARGI